MTPKSRFLTLETTQMGADHRAMTSRHDLAGPPKSGIFAFCAEKNKSKRTRNQVLSMRLPGCLFSLLRLMRLERRSATLLDILQLLRKPLVQDTLRSKRVGIVIAHHLVRPIG